MKMIKSGNHMVDSLRDDDFWEQRQRRRELEDEFMDDIYERGKDEQREIS